LPTNKLVEIRKYFNFTGEKMNRKQKLMKKLAAIADELDMMGETKLVDMITEGLKTVASVTANLEKQLPVSESTSVDMPTATLVSDRNKVKSDTVVMPETKVVSDKPSQSVVMPEVKIVSDLNEKKKRIKELNMKAQKMLDRLLASRGKAGTIRMDGVFDEAGKKALEDFAGKYKVDYNNWSQLFANLQDALDHTEKYEFTLEDLMNAPDVPEEKKMDFAPGKPTEPVSRVQDTQPKGDPNWKPMPPQVDMKFKSDI
jgi:hypothetical protein